MQNQTTRRMFLAAVGATGAVSLAGCSSIPGNGGGGSEPKQPSNTTGSEKPSTTEPGATAPQQRRGEGYIIKSWISGRRLRGRCRLTLGNQ
ncbi:hypothetical protein ACFQL7_05960 [Halocatena marina]|uniref:Twin-arginine translocation signal domain-containing protein n=1 Tax=Halocatena marina TaxID=2934937 RepID=A0ABD5YNQ2_9EURY